MKRKLLYALLIVLMSALCALGLAACDFGSGTAPGGDTTDD